MPVNTPQLRNLLVVLLFWGLCAALVAPVDSTYAAIAQHDSSPNQASLQKKIPPQAKFRAIIPNEVEKLGYINDIAEDAQGFIWIAALQGLARYDGYQLELYQHDEKNPHSLSHNWVISILVDSQKNVWAVTFQGLCRYEPSIDGFNCFKIYNQDSPSSPHTFYNMFEDSTGTIWTSTSKGMLIFDPVTGEFSEVSPALSQALSPMPNNEANFVSTITEDANGQLWIGTQNNGVFRYSPTEEKIEHFVAGTGAMEDLSSNKILSLFIDSTEKLWMGTLGNGLFYYSPEINKFVSFKHSASEKADTVWSIQEDEKGLLWIGDGVGINILDPTSGNIQNYSYKEGQRNGLGNYVVRSVFIDRKKGIWLGFFPSGVDRVDSLASQFINYRHQPGNNKSLPDGGVISTQEDKKGNIWIGCGFGLGYLDRQSNTFTVYMHEETNSNSLSGSTILDLALEKDGSLWIGSWDKGLNRLHPDGKTFDRFMEDQNDTTSMYGREPWGILIDRQQQLWVGTEKGLNLFDRKKNSFERIMPLDDKGSPLQTLYIRHIFQDTTGRIWIASYNGLYELDANTHEFLNHYKHDLNKPDSVSSDQLLTIYEDLQGHIWIGTNGAGLNKFDPDTGRFIHITTEHGLPHMTVSGIVDDLDGNLWVSTYQGLARIDRGNSNITVFDKRHGPSGNLFNRNSPSRLSTGELIFGSSRGVSIFNPANISQNEYAPPTVFTKLSIFNKEVTPGLHPALEESISQTKKINLRHSDSVFSLEFSALDFNAPLENKYAYRLLGFEKNWNSVGTSRTATYTNLDPGFYTFQVKASNNNGVWSAIPSEIEIYVSPPIWANSWAFLLYFVIAAFTIYRVVVVHKKKIEYERKKLEQERAIVRQLKEIDSMKDEINKDLDNKVAERTEELRKEHSNLLAAQNELRSLNKKLENASVTDPLTGLKNRRYLIQSLEEDQKVLVKKFKKVEEDPGSPSIERVTGLTFVVVDIDNFKRINDEYGHTAGDAVLTKLSNLLQNNVRDSDYVVRWGGEEFILVFRYLPKELAIESISRIFEAIASTDFQINDQIRKKITCSMGVASYPFYSRKPSALSWEQVVNLADHALYCAKESGRNCWVSFESPSRILEEDTFINSLKKTELANELKNHRLIISSSKPVKEIKLPKSKAAANNSSSSDD